MKLQDVLPHVNPDGDSVVCHDVMPLAIEIGMFILCDRKPKHSGKHMHHSEKGRVEWWGGASRQGDPR